MLWVSSLWTVGYLVAPTLFVTLPDRVLAGTIAGSMFRVEAWWSVACGLVLFALHATRKPRPNRVLWLIAAMLACTLLGYFALHPFMAALREAAGPSGIMTADARMQFGVLHGVSSGLYLIASLLGLALVLQSRDKE
ncbi:MAG: DUF4149 domain-containing protein [Burkholderiaceae bacterium]|nr:DUF4149 domain-containing protein [Burkholderiaceae bacterium]